MAASRPVQATPQGPEPAVTARQELIASLIARFGADGENPDFPRPQWRFEAMPGVPAIPYWEWVATCIEQDAEGGFDEDFPEDE